MTARLLFFVFFAIAWPTRAATAQAPSELERTFGEARDAFESERYAQAERLLSELYAATQDVNLLFNLYRCQAEQGKDALAYETLGRFLAGAGTIDDRQELEAARRELGCALEREPCDDEPSPPESEEADTEGELARAGEPGQPEGSAAGAAPIRPRWLRIAAGGTLGLAVALAAPALGLGVRSRRLEDDANAEPEQIAGDRLFERARSKARTANAFAGVAAGVLALSVALWIADALRGSPTKGRSALADVSIRF